MARSPIMQLALLVVSLRIVGATQSNLQSFTVFSDPIFLRQGEVHNRYVFPKKLPDEIVQKFAGKTMHLKSVDLDIVLVNNKTGEKVPAPLYMTYNHHHALLLGPTDGLMKLYNKSKDKDPLDPHALPDHTAKHRGCAMKRKSFEALLAAALPESQRRDISVFGGASGAEYRGTSNRLAGPYTYDVKNPESFMVLMHFINSHGVPEDQKLWECPCTSRSKINVTNGTIDGKKPIAFQCSQQLLDQENTGCSLATYEGGYRCCEHGVFLTKELPGPDSPVDQIETKFTFEYYEPDAPETKVARPTNQPSCCDATAGYLYNSSSQFANLEYDVPKCADGTPPDQCVHVIESVEYFDADGQHHSEDEEFELVHAWGHQHVAGLGLELYRVSTNELLCQSRPKYGTGVQAGDERGFVVGIPPCVWGPPPLSPPPKIRRFEHLRTVARYNASEKHHGVMSLWLLTSASLKPGSARVEFQV
ncbi:unnamed protein product [Symbiodinium sp. CCMP2456]|nr:unnamed protein product [Symbiodinium sp. CCMP2456]